MSKITNLIGTTWRLGFNDFAGLEQGYGAFVIDATGTLFGYYDDELIASISGITIRAILAGWGLNDSGAYPVVNVGSVLVQCLVPDTPDYQNLPLGLDAEGVDTRVEFTITGGYDISTPLFIDFINTYGTLVSAPEPEAPTVESVKADMQSLISASNRKTGKSDTTIKQAIVTLLEGYGQGGDSPLPIEVATEAEMTALLSTAEVGSIYKYTGETTDTYENGALYVVEESE